MHVATYNDTSAKGEFWLAKYLKNVKTGFFKMYSMYTSSEFNFSGQQVCLWPGGYLNLDDVYLNIYLPLFVFTSPEKLLTNIINGEGPI